MREHANIRTWGRQASGRMTLDDDRLEELEQNFDHFDRDSNGRIDLEEFAALMAALDAGLDRQELEIGFASIDTDRSGAIDFAEFSAWWSAR